MLPVCSHKVLLEVAVMLVVTGGVLSHYTVCIAIESYNQDFSFVLEVAVMLVVTGGVLSHYTVCIAIESYNQDFSFVFLSAGYCCRDSD